MTRRVAMAAWLVAAWLVLWQDVSVANVVSGLVAAVALVALFPLGRGRARVRVRPVAAARFAGHLAWKLVEANAVVAWQVLRPADRVVEGIVAVPLRTTSDGLATLVANAVTLTPGTMTVDVDRSGEGGAVVLYVHVLQLGDPDDVRRDVWAFEDRVAAAFGGADR